MIRSLRYILLLGIIFVPNFIAEEAEFVPNESQTAVDNNGLILNGKTCGLIATVKSSLESSESVALLLQEMLHTSKAKANELERLTCETEVRDDSKKQSGRLLADDPVGKSTSINVPSAANCYELKEKLRFVEDGIYKVWPRYLNRSVNVFCDMTTTTGGWTLIQRRTDLNGNQENFYRNWQDYKNGFGDLNREFWIGNDVIFALSNEGPTVLRVDLEDFEGVKRYALYNTFEVSTEINKYKLKINGYHGDAVFPTLGDSLTSHNNLFFHTYDKTDSDCVEKFKGGWWYGKCHQANLNGLYLRGNHSSFADGVNWLAYRGYHYSLKNVEMKIRPLLT